MTRTPTLIDEDAMRDKLLDELHKMPRDDRKHYIAAAMGDDMEVAFEAWLKRANAQLLGEAAQAAGLV